MRIIKLQNPHDYKTSDDLDPSDLKLLEELNVQTLIYWYAQGEYDDDEGFALVQINGLWQGEGLNWCPCCGYSPLEGLIDGLNSTRSKSLDNLQKEWNEQGEKENTERVFKEARRFE